MVALVLSSVKWLNGTVHLWTLASVGCGVQDPSSPLTSIGQST